MASVYGMSPNQLEKQEEYAFQKIKLSFERQLEQANLSNTDKFDYYTTFYEKLKSLNITYYRKEILEKIVALKVKKNLRPFIVELAGHYYLSKNATALSSVISKVRVPKKVYSYEDALIVFYKFYSEARVSQELLNRNLIKDLASYGLSSNIAKRDLEILINRGDFKNGLELINKNSHADTVSKITHIALSRLNGKKSKNCDIRNELKIVKDICSTGDDKELLSYVEIFESSYPEEFVVRSLLLELYTGDKQ